MTKISIIVPVYNQEKHINRCLDSILSQTHQDFEILVVNDGSTDSGMAIVDDYATKDPRIKILNKENGGVSSARNLGIKHATGDYIGFVDADDHIKENMYEVLLRNAIEHNASMSLINNLFVINGVPKTYPTDFSVVTYTPQEALKEILDRDKFMGFVNNKLYKTDLIANNHILYNESYHMYEDQNFVTEAMIHSDKIVYENQHLYYYELHDSNSSNQVNDRRMTGLDAYEDTIKKVSLFEPSLVPAYQQVYAEILITTVAQTAGNNPVFTKRIQERLKTIPSKQIQSNTVKLSRILALTAPRVIKPLIKIKNRGN